MAKQNWAHRTWIEIIKTRFPAHFKKRPREQWLSFAIAQTSLSQSTVILQILMISLGIIHYKVSVKVLIELQSSLRANSPNTINRLSIDSISLLL